MSRGGLCIWAQIYFRIEKAEIEFELQNTLHLEVPSVELGDRVLEKLRDIDEISYVRFASVYREFTDVDSFMDELKKLKKKHGRARKTPTARE